MRRVLRLIPDLKFEMIESSCCGMAGTFGLESEHVEQARAMANEGLLPSLAAQPEAEIISNGFGCAYQIQLLDGRRPRHVASLLAQQLHLQRPA